MKTTFVRCGGLAAALLCLPSLLFAQIQITPVVSGLSNPLFVGHAGDGTNRLFILEQAGTIRVVQPGGSTATVFLNISAKVLSGGEQGLLGLAFHPQYISNGRFFVYYTRVGDGALIIAEYKVSSNPNVADPAETIRLTILHAANTNHNGGMLAFGPDGYLYIAVGDGGGQYDPQANAQNKSRLLGKILRIDINTPSGYVSPPTNPFFGVEGRDEIFAFGFRNPWRLSFDRLTGQQWVADVGQGMREEVDTPIASGGNYGWRIYEGTLCTNVEPTRCNPANYIFPVAEYSHAGGRCSITGGYVYRGSLGTLPAGSYIYGDLCSGEILRWNGTSEAVLLDTTMTISSFGEDEAGEIYVVNYAGTVGRIASTAPQCSYSISPTQATFTKAGGNGSINVTAGSGCAWTATRNRSWIAITGGASGIGDGTVTYSVASKTGTDGRTGAITVAGKTFNIRQTAQ